jgi:hypothetical protein
VYIESVDGMRLLHPETGKVITNATNDFYVEEVYMGIDASIDDFVETDPPAAPADPIIEIESLKDRTTKLEDMLAQTNTDFSSFMDYYFAANPE